MKNLYPYLCTPLFFEKDFIVSIHDVLISGSNVYSWSVLIQNVLVQVDFFK